MKNKTPFLKALAVTSTIACLCIISTPALSLVLATIFGWMISVFSEEVFVGTTKNREKDVTGLIQVIWASPVICAGLWMLAIFFDKKEPLDSFLAASVFAFFAATLSGIANIPVLARERKRRQEISERNERLEEKMMRGTTTF